VFPSVFVFGSGNLMLVASKRPMERAAMVRALERGRTRSSQLEEVVVRALPSLRVAVADQRWPLFTDDRNDVELRTFRMCSPGS
jgi:hypothetical protein